MARQFGQYSPDVPLAVSWQETMEYQDENGLPVLLDGLDIVCQLRNEKPTFPDPEDPILEITTVGFRSTPPSWPVVEAFSVSGNTISMTMTRAQFAGYVSPTNARKKVVWQVIAVNKATGYGIPIVEGKVSFLPAGTIL